MGYVHPLYSAASEAPPAVGVQGVSNPYPAVCCLQLKLEGDMGQLREEMEKTQALQTREQQALAEWQAGAETLRNGREGPARPQGAAGLLEPADPQGG